MGCVNRRSTEEPEETKLAGEQDPEDDPTEVVDVRTVIAALGLGATDPGEEPKTVARDITGLLAQLEKSKAPLLAEEPKTRPFSPSALSLLQSERARAEREKEEAEREEKKKEEIPDRF